MMIRRSFCVVILSLVAVSAVAQEAGDKIVSIAQAADHAVQESKLTLAGDVPFAGQRQRLMAEYFATAADVHRLTGELPEDADQHDTADGRGKSAEESAARLARMLGRDLASAELAAWRGLAHHLAECQRRLVQDAMDRVLSRGLLPAAAPVIGAGVGRFLLPEIARRLKRPYRDFADLMQGDLALREWAARAAPAAAVAGLLSPVIPA